MFLTWYGRVITQYNKPISQHTSFFLNYYESTLYTYVYMCIFARVCHVYLRACVCVFVLCVCVCVQGEISSLETKLAQLKEEEARLLAAISVEDGKIEAVHCELAGENSSLQEERDTLQRREQQLQKEEVWKHTHMWILKLACIYTFFVLNQQLTFLKTF